MRGPGQTGQKINFASAAESGFRLVATGSPLINDCRGVRSTYQANGRARGEAGRASFWPCGPSFLHPVCAAWAVARDRARPGRIQPYPRRRRPVDAERISFSLDRLSLNSWVDSAADVAWSGGDIAERDRRSHSDAVSRADRPCADSRTDADDLANDRAGAVALGSSDSGGDEDAATSDTSPDPDDSARPSVMGNVNASAFGTADQRAARVDHKSIEMTLGALRLLAAAAILLLGPAVPNVGPLFVLVLGVFFAGYGLLVMLAWVRVRSSADRERASRFSLAADISLIGFALFVFAPDPSWTIYACGFLVIASGGIRFPSGALLAAASLSLAYVVVMAFRTTTLGIPLSAPLVLLHLGGYLAAGTLLNVVLPELDALREREHDTYEPILQAQDDAGEAVLVTQAGLPTYWNNAFEALTGYTQDDLVEAPAMSDLIVGDDAFPLIAAGEGPFHAQVRTRDGALIEVDMIRRPASASDSDRRVWLLRDASGRQRAEAALREEALHDPLTGLPNRALLQDRLTSAIAVAQRQDTPLSLLMLDLDGFKAVNDTWGHHAGDVVLVEIANRLSGTLRESDTAARLGGDEFVLMLPATPLLGAIEASRALVDFIVAPIAVEGKSLTVGASIGIAVFPNHGRDTQVLLAAADSAMYEAKRSGGGYRTFQAHVGTTQP